MRTFTRFVVQNYEELRRVTRRLPGARAFHTRQPTDFLHEALGSMCGRPRGTWQSRQHFVGAAMLSIQRAIYAHFRWHGAAKRGRGFHRTTVSNLADDCGGPDQTALLALNLERMRMESPRGERDVRILDLYYGWGLSFREIADRLGLDESTVRRSHHYARTRLRQKMTPM